jgi:hypothetical protein
VRRVEQFEEEMEKDGSMGTPVKIPKKLFPRPGSIQPLKPNPVKEVP